MAISKHEAIEHLKNRDTHGLPPDRCLASLWPAPAAPAPPLISIRPQQATPSYALDQRKKPISTVRHKRANKNQFFTTTSNPFSPPEIEKPNLCD